MRFFIDTAEIKEIAELASSGLIDGVTTNPTLIVKSGRNFLEVIKEICQLVSGPVSAEVVSTEYNKMVEEGLKLRAIAENVAVKLPLTWEGLRACKTLSDQNIMVNVTLCFSAAQALLAARAGATFISPFVGRLDDIGQDGLSLIEEICTIYQQYEEIHTQVLVASTRNPMHIVQSAKMGAHVATMPPSLFKQLAMHPLTDKGLAQFVADWAATGQSII
jgi:transaldolase